MLYLCATPIGNLSDMSNRIIETLNEVDLIAAEDTRNSIKLLNHFEIKTPMTSYHEYNKYDKAAELIEKMQNGIDVALITDAGTPAISDPGEVLVKMCHDAGVKVTSLPGPCACITALTLSGLPTRRFCFEAFLPADKKERKEILEELKNETRTIIIYEAPHHLLNTLKELRLALNGDFSDEEKKNPELVNICDRRITLCRELTKKFEEVIPTTINDAISFYEENEPKGEYVLVIEGKDRLEIKKQEIEKWEEVSIEDHMKIYEDKGLNRKDAMKAVAKDRGVSKRDIYEYLNK